MTKPKVSKHTAVNLITNGDFSAGDDGWASNTGGSVRVENGLLLLSGGVYGSATQTVTGLSANENYKLTFSYRVRNTNDTESYVEVNGKIIDRLTTVSEGEELVNSTDHLLSGVTEAQLVFTTASRAVTIDDVVLEAVVKVSQLTVSAETVEHDQTIYCALQAYSPTGEPLINAPVTWAHQGSILITSSSSTTDAQGKAICAVVSDISLPGQEGQGTISVSINGSQLTSPYLTFKRQVK